MPSKILTSPARPLAFAEPLLESYREYVHAFTSLSLDVVYQQLSLVACSSRSSTAGTFRPEDDHHAAAIPPLPMTTLQPAKTPDGKDLLPPPKEELPVEPPRKV